MTDLERVLDRLNTTYMEACDICDYYEVDAVKVPCSDCINESNWKIWKPLGCIDNEIDRGLV